MSKKIGVVVFMISVFILFSIGFYIDYKTKQKFCKLSFHWKIEQIKINTRGAYDIRLKDNTWHYLGMKVLYQIVPIEVGDSIIKEENCYKVTLIKNGTHFNIGNDWETLCDCESSN